MRTRSAFRTLMLASLFAFLTIAAGSAQAPATPQDVPATTAEFLATLAGGQSDAPEIEGLLPSPKFLSTTCTSDAQCPTGQKCCYPCGIPDCEFVCMEVERNRCPFFP